MSAKPYDEPAALLNYEVDDDTLRVGKVEVFKDAHRGRGIAGELYRNMNIPEGINRGETNWSETNLQKFRESLAEYEKKYPGDPNNAFRAANSPSIPAVKLWDRMRGPGAPEGFAVGNVDYSSESKYGQPKITLYPKGPHSNLPQGFYEQQKPPSLAPRPSAYGGQSLCSRLSAANDGTGGALGIAADMVAEPALGYIDTSFGEMMGGYDQNDGPINSFMNENVANADPISILESIYSHIPDGNEILSGQAPWVIWNGRY